MTDFALWGSIFDADDAGDTRRAHIQTERNYCNDNGAGGNIAGDVPIENVQIWESMAPQSEFMLGLLVTWHAQRLSASTNRRHIDDAHCMQMCKAVPSLAIQQGGFVAFDFMLNEILYFGF